MYLKGEQKDCLFMWTQYFNPTDLISSYHQAKYITFLESACTVIALKKETLSNES